TSHDYRHLNPADPDELVARAGYVAGFTLNYDRSCDFLPDATFEKLANSVKAIIAQDGAQDGQQVFKAALKVGFEDAREFLGQHGCATAAAKAARETIEHVWVGKPARSAGF